MSGPNTVHFVILMYPETLLRTFKPAPRERSGNLLILRFTPRGLRRHWLDTRRRICGMTLRVDDRGRSRVDPAAEREKFPLTDSVRVGTIVPGVLTPLTA